MQGVLFCVELKVHFKFAIPVFTAFWLWFIIYWIIVNSIEITFLCFRLSMKCVIYKNNVQMMFLCIRNTYNLE